MAPDPTFRIRTRAPGTLSFEAWMEKGAPYLYGMQEYLERVLSAATWPSGLFVHIDRESMLASFFMYVYKSSINRFRSYQIVE